MDANRFAVLADSGSGAVAEASGSRDRRGKFRAVIAEMFDGGCPLSDVVKASLLFLQKSGLPTRQTKTNQAHTPSDGPDLQRVAAATAGAAKSARKPRSKCKRFRRSHKLRELPVADTGADAHFVGTNNTGEVANTRRIEAVPVDTAGGNVHVDTAADLGALMKDHFLLETSEESLCSVGQVCEDHGHGFDIAPGNSSVTRLLVSMRRTVQ